MIFINIGFFDHFLNLYNHFKIFANTLNVSIPVLARWTKINFFKLKTIAFSNWPNRFTNNFFALLYLQNETAFNFTKNNQPTLKQHKKME